jgi:quercetin dioxygenase-like cupin family protein
MRRLTVLVVLAGLLIAYGSVALATPPSGVTSLPIAKGRFGDIAAKSKTDTDSGTRTDFWQATINTKGSSDLEVLQNTIAPGGTFGWHSHPGPSLVIVKSGTASLYMADDPTCTAQVFATGSGFVDSGGDVHVVRNEGAVDLVVVVASLIPAGAARRIDQPSPGNCPF